MPEENESKSYRPPIETGQCIDLFEELLRNEEFLRSVIEYIPGEDDYEDE